MPRVASTNLPPKRKRDASSPVKASGNKENVVQVQDMSQWRPSRISERTTINKTAAVAEYHLNVNDLKGLPYTRSEASVKIYGADRIVPMYLYKERDIEMRAWEKYGGPEAFERMLNDKAAKYYARHGTTGKPFPKPRSYHVANDPMSSFCVGTFTQPEHMPDTETSTPMLIRIKEAMEDRGDGWLWERLNHLLDEWDYDLTRHEREVIMERAFVQLPHYPKRPASPPPSESAPFKALTDLLKEAPAGWDAPGVEMYTDYPPGDGTVDWNLPYREKVYDCLDAVKEEHGREGWEKARWLVYDKYVECGMGGLEYDLPYYWSRSLTNEMEWKDTARHWLEEQPRVGL